MEPCPESRRKGGRDPVLFHRRGAGVSANEADAEELCTVKGIGPKLAAAIIGEREQNGAFRYWEDLLCVRGIGEKTLRKLEGQLGLP